MPPDSGMAFVLIPHLDPTHESLMVELLAKQTRMSVVEAGDGMAVEPNRVYVIPPNRSLAIREGVLRLSRLPEPRGLQTAIDSFLRSLAEDQKERAIGIVFSGTGSHGTRGLREIKAAGGLIMAQAPESADYDQMPRAVIATGLVDYVLPPEAMPEALIKYARHAYVNRVPEAAAPEETAPEHLNRILALLRARTKHDFRAYRKNMLMRRVQRRMGLCHIDRLADYLEHLRDQGDEVRALSRDLLIGVTGFFREPEAFQVLAQRVLPELVQRSGRRGEGDRPIRVWVPGCATGEEAYSIAMLLMEEYGAARRPVSVQIFATDIDEEALDVARAGVYPESITSDVSADRLQQFFVKLDEHHYQVSKQLREAIVVAPQNLISDAPFSRLDLVSCRNVLIYLEPEVQEKVVPLFHFALRDDGYLLLGPSETVGPAVDLFEPISKKWRVYRRIAAPHRDLVDIPIVTTEERRRTSLPTEVAPRAPRGVVELMHRVLLDDFTPASALVNRRYEVLCMRGPLVDYLHFPPGEPTRDLLSMARPGLRSKIRSACQAAVEGQGVATEADARVKRDGGHALCSVTVRSISEPKEAEGLLLVTFQDRPPDPGSAQAATRAAPSQVEESRLVQQIEYELKTTREELQSTIEELESSNEELKASNEEVMSMNEELQSANEELETSKEELQSLNEELSTVNNQLQDKVDELDKANNDMVNLLASTDIATVFLDPELRIKRFTPPTAKLLNLVASDVGRPLRDFAPRFSDTALLDDCRHVIQRLTPAEAEITTDDERTYLRRVLPYRTADNRIEGVVITFVDVTERRRAAAALDAARHYARMVEHLPAGAVYVTEDRLTMNRAAEEITGYTRDELPTVGAWFSALHGERAHEARQAYQADRQSGFPLRSPPTAIRRKNGETRVVEMASYRFDDAEVWLMYDVTERQRAQEALRDREESLRSILETAVDAIITIDTAGRILSFNPAAERMFGYSASEVGGRYIRLLMPAPYREEHDGYLARYLETGEARIIGVGREVVGLRKDGTTFPMELTVSEVRHRGRFTGIIRDISERKALERSLADRAVEERAHVARELHDEIGGLVTGMAMLAQTLHTQLVKEGSPLAARARDLVETIVDSQEKVRALSAGLMPLEAVPEGLMAGLRGLSEQCAKAHGIRCRFVCVPPVRVHDLTVAAHLYRIAQEAVNNAVRHGEPQEIVVTLSQDQDSLKLIVADDGRGLGQGARDNAGLGFQTMRQRAHLLHGELEVQPREPRGTVVTCRVPRAGEKGPPPR
jgi:two-component system CheB/CheR fusion protein